jgi:Lon protease-like protein
MAKSSLETRVVPIFALRTVFYPGGILPLRVFEPRYMDMCKESLRDGKPFGVCSIVSGAEVGAPAEFASIGTLATITTWDMEQLGILSIVCEGGRRFVVVEREVLKSGLAQAEVRLLDDETPEQAGAPPPMLANLLEKLIDKIGDERFGKTRHYDDANWVSYRLAEILPIKQSVKQKLLEVNDSAVRLSVIAEFLRLQGIGDK